jgi:hypothetical protein
MKYLPYGAAALAYGLLRTDDAAGPAAVAELGVYQNCLGKHSQGMIIAGLAAFATMGAPLLIYHRHNNLAALFLQKGPVRKEKVGIGLLNIAISDCDPPSPLGMKGGGKRGGNQGLAGTALAAGYG